MSSNFWQYWENVPHLRRSIIAISFPSSCLLLVQTLRQSYHLRNFALGSPYLQISATQRLYTQRMPPTRSASPCCHILIVRCNRWCSLVYTPTNHPPVSLSRPNQRSLDDPRWRDVLTSIDLREIEPQRRTVVMDVIIRLLFGLMLEKRGRSRGLKSEGGNNYPPSAKSKHFRGLRDPTRQPPLLAPPRL
jgi:hypothetical protein